MDRDLRAFVALAASKAFVVGSGLAISLIVGRILGPSGFGQWVLIVAAATFLHTALVNWTHSATVRFGHEEWVTTGSISRSLSARLPILFLSGALAAAILMTRPFDWLALGFGLHAESVWLVAVYATGLWLMAEAQATLQATGRIDRQAQIAPVAAIGAMAVLLLLAWSGMATLATAVAGVSFVQIGIWGTVWLGVLARLKAWPARPARAEVRRQLKYSGPLLAAFAVGYLSDWGDHLLLRTQASLEVVGQFGLAYQVFATLLAANGVVSTLMLPRLIAHHALTADAADRYMRRVVPTVFTLWLIAATLIVAVLPSVVTVLAGRRFEPSAASLVVLCVIVPTSILTSLYSVLFSLQERLDRVLVYTAAMTAVNLALSFLLIPVLGPVGAALGTAVSYAVAQLAYMRDQHRLLARSVPGVTVAWVVSVVCGVMQIAVDTLPARLLWAAVAVTAIVWTAKRTGAVDGSLLERLLAGAWPPAKTMLHRLLVPSGPGVP